MGPDRDHGIPWAVNLMMPSSDTGPDRDHTSGLMTPSSYTMLCYTGAVLSEQGGGEKSEAFY
jgi:hypothetical protein